MFINMYARIDGKLNKILSGKNYSQDQKSKIKESFSKIKEHFKAHDEIMQSLYSHASEGVKTIDNDKFLSGAGKWEQRQTVLQTALIESMEKNGIRYEMLEKQVDQLEKKVSVLPRYHGDTEIMYLLSGMDDNSRNLILYDRLKQKQSLILKQELRSHQLNELYRKAFKANDLLTISAIETLPMPVKNITELKKQRMEHQHPIEYAELRAYQQGLNTLIECENRLKNAYGDKGYIPKDSPQYEDKRKSFISAYESQARRPSGKTI